MTTPEEHKQNFEQFINDIKEKIRANLLLERQKIIAFDASEASTNLVEYFFHKKNLIPLGFKVNHNYFVSTKRAERYLNFDFPKKKELIELMVNQEKLRNLLCYGKEKEINKVKEAIENIDNFLARVISLGKLSIRDSDKAGNNIIGMLYINKILKLIKAELGEEAEEL